MEDGKDGKDDRTIAVVDRARVQICVWAVASSCYAYSTLDGPPRRLEGISELFGPYADRELSGHRSEAVQRLVLYSTPSIDGLGKEITWIGDAECGSAREDATRGTIHLPHCPPWSVLEESSVLPSSPPLRERANHGQRRISGLRALSKRARVALFHHSITQKHTLRVDGARHCKLSEDLETWNSKPGPRTLSLSFSSRHAMLPKEPCFSEALSKTKRRFILE